MVKKTEVAVQWHLIVPLAALGLVRTFMHIFRVVEMVPATEGLAWLGTAVVWIAFVVGNKMPRPFLSLLLIGLVHGIFAALAQQIFWSGFWAGYPPVQIGEVMLPIDSPTVRTVAVISSIVTGLGWGFLLGVIALAIAYPKTTTKKKRK